MKCHECGCDDWTPARRCWVDGVRRFVTSCQRCNSVEAVPVGAEVVGGHILIASGAGR